MNKSRWSDIISPALERPSLPMELSASCCTTVTPAQSALFLWHCLPLDYPLSMLPHCPGPLVRKEAPFPSPVIMEILSREWSGMCVMVNLQEKTTILPPKPWFSVTQEYVSCGFLFSLRDLCKMAFFELLLLGRVLVGSRKPQGWCLWQACT